MPEKPSGQQLDPSHALRRQFLGFLAASPLLGSWKAFAQEVEATPGEQLTGPSEVLSVFEMEAIARERIPPAHYGYLVTGSDNDGTVRANRAGCGRHRHPDVRLHPGLDAD